MTIPQPADEPDEIAERAALAADADRERTVRRVCSLVNLACTVCALLLLAYVVLTVGHANQGNRIVEFVNGASAAVSLGFRDLFTLSSTAATVIVDNGLAAGAWLLVSAVARRLVRGVGLPASGRPARRRWRITNERSAY